MTWHSHRCIVTQSTAGLPLTEEVVIGKHVCERNSCINRHTLHGEGAYFAPELGNVTTRWGVYDDPEGASEVIKGPRGHRRCRASFPGQDGEGEAGPHAQRAYRASRCAEASPAGDFRGA